MKISFSEKNFTITTELERYADNKIARLGRIIPKQLRTHASCHIKFGQTTHGKVKHNTCVLTVKLEDTELKAEETTIHMYAALDIACVHLEHQLSDYAAGRRQHRIRHLLRNSFRRKPD